MHLSCWGKQNNPHEYFIAHCKLINDISVTVSMSKMSLPREDFTFNVFDKKSSFESAKQIQSLYHSEFTQASTSWGLLTASQLAS